MRIIITGKAGSGKDYFRDYLSRVEVVNVKYTTRPPREREVDGYSYNFLTTQSLLNLITHSKFRFLERHNGWLYGISEEDWNNDVVFILTPSEINNLTKEERKESIVVFLDIPEDILKNRIMSRGDLDGERRLAQDRKDFFNFKNFDIKVKNSNFVPEEIFYKIIKFEKNKF